MNFANLTDCLGNMKIYRFYNLAIKKLEDGRPAVGFMGVDEFNEKRFWLVPISNERLLDIAINLSINNGYIAKYMTFLETIEGIDVFPSDSKEVKKVLNENSFSKKDIPLGAAVDTFVNVLNDEANHCKLVYLGTVDSQVANKVFYLFARVNLETLELSDYREFDLSPTFPKVLEYQEIFDNVKVEELRENFLSKGYTF